MAVSKFLFVSGTWLLYCPSVTIPFLTLEAFWIRRGWCPEGDPSRLGESSWGPPVTIGSVIFLFLLAVSSWGFLRHVGLILLLVFLFSSSLGCWAVILGMLLAPNSVLLFMRSPASLSILIDSINCLWRLLLQHLSTLKEKL